MVIADWLTDRCSACLFMGSSICIDQSFMSPFHTVITLLLRKYFFVKHYPHDIQGLSTIIETKNIS